MITMSGSKSLTLDGVLRDAPPPLLFHYTSSASLIGILSYKTVWATNISFLNDSKELNHAVDITRNTVNFIRKKQNIGSSLDLLLEQMSEWAESAAKRIYVFSLTEQRDLLSQWRAYCPKGGYSLGLPSSQLSAVARETDFVFCRCEYDYQIKHMIVQEWINSAFLEFEQLVQSGHKDEDARKRVSYNLAQHLALYGCILKHEAFREEREWRLISRQIADDNENIRFRATEQSIVPYYAFSLVSSISPDLVRGSESPNSLTLIRGPSENWMRDSFASQIVLTRLLDKGWYQGRSDIPYRNT